MTNQRLYNLFVHSNRTKWQVLLDQVVEDWVGLVLPRPIVALGEFEQHDGCTWCGHDYETNEVCPCASRHLEWVRVFRLGVYGEPLSDCILQGKYAAWSEMLELLGTMLGERIRGCVPPHTIVVPVPMPPMRRFFRRIDHAHVLARSVSIASNLPIKRVLRRKESQPQAAKTASQRKTMKRNLMKLRLLSRVQGRSILLVDDVLTTGRTLEVASQAIKAAGASLVMVAVVAVTNLPRNDKKM